MLIVALVEILICCPSQPSLKYEGEWSFLYHLAFPPPICLASFSIARQPCWVSTVNIPPGYFSPGMFGALYLGNDGKWKLMF